MVSILDQSAEPMSFYSSVVRPMSKTLMEHPIQLVLSGRQITLNSVGL
jgi:hypothetical protein